MVSRRLSGVVLLASAISASGCGALEYLFFNFTPCDYGLCGQSGHLLHLQDDWITERIGTDEWAPYLISAPGSRAGAFAQTSRGLRFYVCAEDGLRDYDGYSRRLDTNPIVIPDCRPSDIVVLADGDVIVACPATVDHAGRAETGAASGRLVRVRPSERRVVESYSCCEGSEDGFYPFGLALTPGGKVLAGTRQIRLFDPVTGDYLGVAVPPGVQGAASYDAYGFGPSGNLFVSANPLIGLLEFDGSSFEFVATHVEGGLEGMLEIGPFFFDVDNQVVRLDELLSTWDGRIVYELDMNTFENLRLASRRRANCCLPDVRSHGYLKRP